MCCGSPATCSKAALLTGWHMASTCIRMHVALATTHYSLGRLCATLTEAMMKQTNGVSKACPCRGWRHQLSSTELPTSSCCQPPVNALGQQPNHQSLKQHGCMLQIEHRNTQEHTKTHSGTQDHASSGQLRTLLRWLPCMKQRTLLVPCYTTRCSHPPMQPQCCSGHHVLQEQPITDTR